jgi:hypothetical protein
MNEDAVKALMILGAALLVGAIAQAVIRHEAAVLGLSAFELALVGVAVGGAVQRRLS